MSAWVGGPQGAVARVVARGRNTVRTQYLPIALPIFRPSGCRIRSECRRRSGCGRTPEPGAEKLGNVRVIPGNASDVAVTRVSSPKNSASTAAPAPLNELCPDT